MELEPWFRGLDKFAGGRHAAYRIPLADRQAPPTVATFRTVTRLLGVGLVVGGLAVVEAFWLHVVGSDVSRIVWMRLLVILGMTASLFYFIWRAKLGYWWAYSRLRLFSTIFPVVAVVTSAIPGLYPGWMIAEQIGFSALLVLVSLRLSTPHMKRAYAKPSRT